MKGNLKEYAQNRFRDVSPCGLTVVDEGFYKFIPHSFTFFLLLAESHASVHAWPDYNYCAIDLFTCNLGKDLIPLVQEIKDALGADNFSLRKLDRDGEVEIRVPMAV